MTADAIPWLVAGVCAMAFIVLWFSVCHRELAGKRRSLDFVAWEVRRCRGLRMQERGGENDALAENMLETKLMVYRKLAREYNELLKSPANRIPGFLMGFREDTENGR